MSTEAAAGRLVWVPGDLRPTRKSGRDISRLRESPFGTRRKSLRMRFKDRGQPCRRGETAARSGCIPASKKPGGGGVSRKPPAPKQTLGPRPKVEAKPLPEGGKPTVDDLQVDIQGLRNAGQVSIPALTGTINKMLHLTVKELEELKRRLNVKASGPKAELARKIIERATSRLPQTIYKLKPDEGALKVKVEVPKILPFKDRLGMITKREAMGGAPFIDMLIVKLKTDRLVNEDLPSSAVFADLKRQSVGLEPLHFRIRPSQLGKVLDDLAPDFGKLKGTELMRILPFMKYPTQEEAGVTDQASIVSMRKIPTDVADKLKAKSLVLLPSPFRGRKSLRWV